MANEKNLNILITADSTCDVPNDLLEKHNIIMMPSYVILGDEEMLDFPCISNDELFDFYKKTKTLPKTATANPQEYTDFFSKYLESYDAIIHISKSSKISASHINAVTGASDLKNVYIVDSLSISVGSALVVLKAVELNNGVNTPEQIVEELNKYRTQIRSGFLIEQLEYLRDGGRCSTIAMIGANLLKLRPEVVVIDGEMKVNRKLRGPYKNCIMNLIDERLANLKGIDDEYIFIAYTTLDDDVLQGAIERIKSKNHFKNVIVVRACNAVACHCGPSTFGFFYVENN